MRSCCWYNVEAGESWLPDRAQLCSIGEQTDHALQWHKLRLDRQETRGRKTLEHSKGKGAETTELSPSEVLQWYSHRWTSVTRTQTRVQGGYYQLCQTVWTDPSSHKQQQDKGDGDYTHDTSDHHSECHQSGLLPLQQHCQGHTTSLPGQLWTSQSRFCSRLFGFMKFCFLRPPYDPVQTSTTDSNPAATTSPKHITTMLKLSNSCL